MTLIVPDEIAKAVNELSLRSGQSPERLLISAIRAHFPPVPNDLQEEFEALERASDDDLAQFERTLEH